MVKSPENAQQWTSIRNRLLATGMQFCVIESANWETTQDLGDIRVLFLPNVEQITGQQADTLETWMGKGGKVIVSGPTGSLSELEVKTQLRSLFGAYWGYPNSSPSTLKLLEKAQLSPPTTSKLTATFIGGVIIPTAINTQAAAVWQTQGKPPAVLLKDNTIFLGWRWGVDSVTSAAFDTAWLQTALNRYGVNQNSQLSIPGAAEITPCNPNSNQKTEPFPILPQQYIPNTPSPATPTPPIETPNPSFPQSSRPVAPTVASSPKPLNNTAVPSAISVTQAKTMGEELENLIARFESTLLATEASNSGLDRSSLKLTQQPLDPPQTKPSDVVHQSHQTLIEAKQSLNQFYQLINQQQYEQGRQVWLKARRSLWDNYPTDRQFAQPEIRAMWLDRGTIVKNSSEADLAVIFDRMAQSGINTVFIETVNASYPIYPSRVAPEQNPLTKGWDPLKVAIKLAHERGMEIHAWVWVFGAANQGHNKVLEQPIDYLGPVLSRNPDWGITDQEGNFFDKGPQFKKAFLDPANPKVQQYLLSLFDEIVSNYDVDGIQFDYIRYPFQQPQLNQTFGYSKASRALFKDITGVDPIEISPGHPLWNQWTGFRVRQVDSFVANAATQLKRKRPDLIVSASVFPIEQRDRLFRLQQNWEEWISRGWVDMIVLMTYALDTDRLEERTQPLFDKSLSGSALVVPGLRLLKVPDSVTIDQLQLIRNMPGGGFALFAAENLTPSLQTLLSRTQTPKTSQALPYRQPFKAAVGRYQALEQEWNFLLNNQQLVIAPVRLTVWNQQKGNLGNALNQLANEPSSQHLIAARKALSQFQQQFSIAMGQYKIRQPYQFQVWENRLNTLDKLLTYGERIVLREGRNINVQTLK
ncbi:FenI protein [Aphanothece sacrum FPU1]|uniref:FenI protein n=1 Tax=Aphanothece sacrum FPU1 TaxID=1920663 RepID=A0A401ICG6_APHSA|nr:FenI protein [Aphanothece sacrum FPU1]GBF86669.1 FenI protein [Aphanothece sacrum FPU3]